MPSSIHIAFKKFKENQSWSWAFRLAITVCVPLIFSLLLEDKSHLFWVILSAQSMGFIESKGTNGHVIRNLVIATLLSCAFCIIGTLSGTHFLAHILMMFIVGFISAMFKNLGERGMGVSLSLYLFFIFTSSYPSSDWGVITDRLSYVLIGSLWGIFVSIIFMLAPKSGLGFRKSMAEVFQEMAVLTEKARAGFAGTGIFTSVRELYIQEVKIRKALNLSIELYSTSSASDIVEINAQQVQYLRKIVSLLNIHLLEIIDKTQRLKIYRKEFQIDTQVHAILRVWDQIFDFMKKYLISLSTEDKMLLESRVERLKNLIEIQQKNEPVQLSKEAKVLLHSLYHLCGRMMKLVERYISIIDVQDEKSSFKIYSFTYTLSLLHPKLFSNDWKDFFKLDVEMTKYALRVAIAVSLGYVLDYFFFPEYGYWIPFTSIIVAQPYINATIKKGVERSIGTLLGVVVGYYFMLLPHSQIWNIALLFVSSIMSIYFLKKHYSISTFFVTLSMIGIISLSTSSPTPQDDLLTIRVLCTIIGAALSILMAFFFMSTWDKSLLPIHLKDALKNNYLYFLYSPFLMQKDSNINWLKSKRISESSNATLYDSFNRWISEPKITKIKSNIAHYFSKITHIIRLTKEINNLNGEHENLHPSTADQYIFMDPNNQKLKNILDLYSQCLQLYGMEHILDNYPIDLNQVRYYSKTQLISMDKIFIELNAILQTNSKMSL